MNVTTDRAQETWHELQNPGSYEWWYFDAEDEESGVSVVLIWFAGFAFSPYYVGHYQQWREQSRPDAPLPGEYSGFSFQLYEKGVELVNFIKEGDGSLFESAVSGIGVRFENNRFSCDLTKDEYLLTVDFDFPAMRKRVSASLQFTPQHTYSFSRNDGSCSGSTHRHQWLLSVPKAEVTGEVLIESGFSGQQRRVMNIRGKGYHDHNFGTMPMHEYIEKWYWGRAFSDRFDLVYYIVFFRGNGTVPLTMLLLNDNHDGKQHIKEQARFREEIYSRGLFAPAHGRRLFLEQEGVNIEISHRNTLDAGPFYLRFESQFAMDVDGFRVDGLRGISEYMNPSGLQSGIMRFFTCSRIWRDGKRSAMYTGYNFFKSHFDWFNTKIF